MCMNKLFSEILEEIAGKCLCLSKNLRNNFKGSFNLLIYQHKIAKNKKLKCADNTVLSSENNAQKEIKFFYWEIPSRCFL